jgi:hypothetical protein
MTPCPRCGRPGGVQLFTSISPCDACLSGKVEADSRLNVKLLGGTYHSSRFGDWVVLCLCVAGEEWSRSLTLVDSRGKRRLAEFIRALTGTECPQHLLYDTLQALCELGCMDGAEFQLPAEWFE